ncbi:MAG TPA: ABC transporter permease, partial [Myxococcales bacterium]|nr:ABC transporter permease [Myxococcales bacterium]
ALAAPQAAGAQRKRRRFSFLAALAVLVGQIVAGAVVGGGTVLLASRLSLAPERALVVAGTLGLLVALFAGFVAAAKARKICFWETGATGLLFVVGASLIVGRTLMSPYGLFMRPGLADIAYLANLLGNPIGGVVLAAIGVWAATFIGGSLGYLFAGSGRLDLRFGYEAFVARSHLRLRKKSPTMIMTVISVLGVAVGVVALTVVLSVMSGFELDLKNKIVGTNAHAVVLKYGTDFSEWPTTAEQVRKVKGVTGVTPFILNEVMVSSDQNMSGALIKGIEPSTVDQVTNLRANLKEGDLGWLEAPEKIPTTTPGSRFRISPTRIGDPASGAFEPSQLSGERDQGQAEAPALAEEDILKPKAPAKGEEKGLPGIVLGKELAHSLKVMVGDRINVISPLGGELGPTGPMPKSRPFRVAGIFFSGMYEYDAKFAYTSLTESQRFFGLGGSVTGLELKTGDIDNTRQITRSVLRDLDGYPYRTKDWGEMNKNLFSALRLEKLVMAVILGFIVLVACFNIVSTLIMMVLEKGKDIAILKSMGATDTSVMKVFVLEGLIIGVIGTLVGLVLGYFTCLFVEVFGIRLDAEVYYIDKLPVQIDPLQFAAVAGLAVLLSYLATIYPATRASRLPPVDGLRNE